MKKRTLTAILAAVFGCFMLTGCGDEKNEDYVKFTEAREPIDNVMEALKIADGEMLTHSYFSPELLKYEAEVWSNMTIDEYYKSFDNYLAQVNEYYIKTYGEDYVLEYTDGLKIKLGKNEFADVQEKYDYETKGEQVLEISDGHVNYGTLSIKGSLGEDSEELDIMVVYDEDDGWFCYLTDLFFTAFYEEE